MYKQDVILTGMLIAVLIQTDAKMSLGGEDNRLVIWKPSAPASDQTTQKTRKTGKSSNRFNPYSR